jgi:hypothetical protein
MSHLRALPIRFTIPCVLVSAVLGGAVLFAAETPPGSAPLITASGAQQIQALVTVKQSKTPVQNKIDSRLFLGMLHERRDARLALLTSYNFLTADADGRVLVHLALAEPAVRDDVLSGVAALGGVVVRSRPGQRMVAARVRLRDLETIAALPGVQRVREPLPRTFDAVNVSEGVATHGASEAAAFFGVSGSGVKVGVISNGCDSLATLQGSGDLPLGITILPGQGGTGDEGCAMMEIVHDMAPDAQLYFAGAGDTDEQFAQNILDLAAAGCQVIVDDVLSLDESPFEDQQIAQAVNTVAANGVFYFSSAGNQGNLDDGTSGSWEGDFSANGTIAALPGAGVVHNFGDGGHSILVTKGAPIVVMTWAEHYTENSGIASTDYDMYRMNAALTAVLDGSTNVQDGTGNDDLALEYFFGVNPGERIVVTRYAVGTTAPPMLNLLVYRGNVDSSLATTGASSGHNSAAQGFGVAATPAAAPFDPATPTGPYPGLFGPVNASETFTSDGPRRFILRSDGSEYTPGNRSKTGGIVRAKPDITAADGVSCAAPGFAPFYGTSAAAPHAAAIAALLKSALPDLTLPELRTALVGSAIDIETPGNDRDTGAGIVMAHAALDAAGVTGPLGPQPMEVDAHAVPAIANASNVNGVWEPGEFVEISPSWKNNQVSSQALTGAGANLTGPPDNGTFYNLTGTVADYGTIAAGGAAGCHDATGNCYVAGVTNTRPTSHWDATFTETLSTGVEKIWKLHIGNTFPDVPVSSPFYAYVENLIHNGVTGGCGGGNYCPGNPVTRAQMAIFLLKGKHGFPYVPPACSGAFADVSCASTDFAVDWIEELAEEGITGGCGGGNYCPGNAVTRAQMAIFLLKAEHGSSYTPPACVGIFPDVPCMPAPAFAVDWIEQLYNEGITGGCSGGNYCPNNPVLRSQMAVFLVKTFGLHLYGP